MGVRSNRLVTTMPDEYLRILADAQRRRVLLALLDHNPQSDRLELPVDDENAVVGVDRQDIDLYHIQLPKLEAEGLIRWDRDEHEVEKGPRFEEIRPLVELLDDHADDLPFGWP